MKGHIGLFVHFTVMDDVIFQIVAKFLGLETGYGEEVGEGYGFVPEMMGPVCISTPKLFDHDAFLFNMCGMAFKIIKVLFLCLQKCCRAKPSGLEPQPVRYWKCLLKFFYQGCCPV